MIRSLVKIGTKIGAWSLPGSELLQELGENVAYNIICHNWIMTQPQCILINCRCELIEDGCQRFLVQILGSFKQADTISHEISTLPSERGYMTQINTKRFLNIRP